MKFAASVSLAALALAGCAATTARRRRSPSVPAAPPRPAATAAASADRRRRARVHRRGRKGSVRPQRDRAAAPPGSTATYINDDTDALAAYFGTIGTEKGVKYATRGGANMPQVPGLDSDTARKLNILRGGAGPGGAARRRAPRPSSTTSPPGCSRPTARAAPRITARRSPATMPKR